MRGMVVGEGGRSSGVLLYLNFGLPLGLTPSTTMSSTVLVI